MTAYTTLGSLFITYDQLADSKGGGGGGKLRHSPKGGGG